MGPAGRPGRAGGGAVSEPINPVTVLAAIRAGFGTRDALADYFGAGAGNQFLRRSLMVLEDAGRIVWHRGTHEVEAL